MILLLDTSVLIDVLRLRQDRLSLLKKLVNTGHSLTFSIISLAEIYAGVRPGEKEATEHLLSSLHCYSLTPAIARRGGTMKQAWARKGRTLARTDMLIAATALEHELTLITDNHKDFPMPELLLFTP